MKRLLIVLFAASVSAPALAQHSGHAMPAAQPGAQPQPRPECPAPAQPNAQNPHAGHGAQASPPPATPDCRPPASPQPQTPAAPANPHAGHDMPPAQPTQPTSPMPGHDMSNMPPARPGQPASPMPGHDMSNMPQGQGADPMAGHDMSTMGGTLPDPPVAPPAPEALSGPAHAAETIFPADQVVAARAELLETHGGSSSYRFLADQLEVGIRDGRDGYVWDDVQFWYGGDINKLWIKSQGEGTFGEGIESAEVQALWSRAIDPWFDLQAGVRHDFRPSPQRHYLVLGFQGLAPYWFEIDAAMFLSNKGDLSARFEAEYDQRITQRLILQPRVELDLAAQDVPEIGVGSGLSTAELGLRLRYEFFPTSSPAVIAPYVGVDYERAFGDTADFRRAAGDRVGGWSLVMGVRTWF